MKRLDFLYLFPIIIVLSILLVNFMAFLAYSGLILGFEYNINYIEPYVFQDTVRMYEESRLYTDIFERPFTVTLYPPVYYLFSALPMLFIGKSLIVGRAVSFISALLIGLIIYKIIHNETSNRSISLISFLLFFVSEYVFRWSTLFRVDMLGILFTALGVYFILYYKKSKNNCYFSIIFFILAIFTKSELILGPIAACIYLFLNHERSLTKIIFIYMISLTAFILILENMTRSEYVLHTLIYSIPGINYSFEFFFEKIFLFFQKNLLFIIGGTYILIKRKPPFLCIYLILILISLIKIGKTGSDTNYYLELMFVLTIGTALLIYEIIKNKNKWQNMKMLLVFVFIFLVIFPSPLGKDTPEGYPFNVYEKSTLIESLDPTNFFNFYHYVEENLKEYSDIMKKTEEYLIDKNSSFIEGYSVGINKNKDIEYGDPYTLQNLDKVGLWDEQIVVNKCENIEFDIIIKLKPGNFLSYNGVNRDCLKKYKEVINSEIPEKITGMKGYSVLIRN